MIGWLLDAVSEWRPNFISGIAVEPVAEHLDRLRCAAQKMPHVALAQVAIGAEDRKDVNIHALTQQQHDAILEAVLPKQRKDLAAELLFLLNMSCVGCEHPDMDSCRKWISSTYGVVVPLEPLSTQLWSYSHLAEHYNFSGCELLIIDAEGYDAQILRSMLAHCHKEMARGINAWPEVIQCETQGHCDKIEGAGTEEQLTRQLLSSGYIRIFFTSCNSNFIYEPSLRGSKRLQRWMSHFYCRWCGWSESFPFTNASGSMCCWSCYCTWTSHC